MASPAPEQGSRLWRFSGCDSWAEHRLSSWGAGACPPHCTQGLPRPVIESMFTPLAGVNHLHHLSTGPPGKSCKIHSEQTVCPTVSEDLKKFLFKFPSLPQRCLKHIRDLLLWKPCHSGTALKLLTAIHSTPFWNVLSPWHLSTCTYFVMKKGHYDASHKKIMVVSLLSAKKYFIKWRDRAKEQSARNKLTSKIDLSCWPLKRAKNDDCFWQK